VGAETLLRGGYVLLVLLREPVEIKYGTRLCRLATGLYAYVGSALRGVEARVSRHCTKTKRLRWHIDVLTTLPSALVLGALAISGGQGIEQVLAEALKRLGEPICPGFGSSDSSDPTHLFRVDLDALSKLCHMYNMHYLPCLHAYRVGDAEPCSEGIRRLYTQICP